MPELLTRRVGVVVPLTTLIMVGLLPEAKIRYVWWVYITYAVIVTLRDIVIMIQMLKISDSKSNIKQVGGS